MTVRGLVLGLFGGFGKHHSKSKSAEQERGKGDDEHTDWVTVVTLYTTTEVSMAAARLEDEGIPVRLSQEAASSAIPVNVGILGAIHVLVPEPLLDKARKVLEATMDLELPDEEDES